MIAKQQINVFNSVALRSSLFDDIPTKTGKATLSNGDVGEIVDVEGVLYLSFSYPNVLTAGECIVVTAPEVCIPDDECLPPATIPTNTLVTHRYEIDQKRVDPCA